MQDRVKEQQKDNSAARASLMVCDVSEALWRLRAAPTAAEMVRLLPVGSLIGDDLVDLTIAAAN